MKLQRQIIQQPLASTSNWSAWDDALYVSLWILAFGRWVEFYLRELGESDLTLGKLSLEAQELTMVTPIEEWQSENSGSRFELIAFLGQVEGLLS